MAKDREAKVSLVLRSLRLAVGRAAGVTQQAVQRYESGEDKMGAGVCEKIAAFLAAHVMGEILGLRPREEKKA